MGIKIARKPVVRIGEVSLIRDINFFQRYQESERKTKNVSKDSIAKIACVTGLGIVILCVWGGFQVVNGGIKNEIQSIQNYIDSSDIQNQLTELGKKVELYNVMDQYAQTLQKLDDRLATHIQFTTVHLDEIRSVLPANTRIEDIQYAEGGLAFSCLTNEPKKITEYVSNLRKIGFVQEVLYNGFTTEQMEDTDEQNKDDKKEYVSNIQLTLLPEKNLEVSQEEVQDEAEQ